MSTEEVANTHDRMFPGGELTVARESLGLGFEQLTRELHLPVRTLQAIEAGELKGLGGPVFVRGYIRAYAKRLKLDPERYVALCDEFLGVRDTSAPVRVVGSVSTTPARQSRSLMRLGSLLFVIAIVGVVVWWWQTQYSIDSVLSEQVDAPVTVDTADGNTLVLPALDDEPVTEADSLPVPETAAAEPESSVSDGVPASESAAGAEGAASLTAAEVELGATDSPAEVPSDAAATDTAAEVVESATGLHLVLSEESWLSIQDGNGRSLFNGIASAGSDLDFDGVAPLSVVIGRASAVTLIEYAGKPVDLSAVSNKNVARLKLSAPQP